MELPATLVPAVSILDTLLRVRVISVMWVDFSVIEKIGPQGRRIPFQTTVSAPASSTDARLTCLHHPLDSCSQAFLNECGSLSFYISHKSF